MISIQPKNPTDRANDFDTVVNQYIYVDSTLFALHQQEQKRGCQASKIDISYIDTKDPISNTVNSTFARVCLVGCIHML